MKGAQSLGQFLTIALALTPLTSAWPEWLPDVDSLVVRADDGTSSAEPTPTATKADDKDNSSDDSKTITSDVKTTTAADSDEPQTTNLNTAVVTTKTGGHGNSTASPTHQTFDPQDGAGGVAMITPATTAGTTLYRIGDPTPITWVWNYTSLQGTPTAIDVLVSCSTASATWTLTQNMTFEPTATFTWDTEKYSESAVASPLLVAQYTLLIYDSDSSADATAEAGYLAPFDGFQFGLYTSRPYQDLGEWKCATCSGALGDLDRQALGFAITMSIITVFSFTWYVTGFAAML
ncbi:hypothetical protein F4815DRAFT_460962 [Daldinia loculata]|uniref:uncharacterized protein n=1 Tax=Daldinia loculata TaxID=103429 RepID=UPI0020C37B5F|nr:uncharacterized protein F4817DRAFT_334025 [Daldinia loculata]KAI1648467.1 hypothetical protein F4817DRAFT_334025 [Daldinia loculata]KAI2782859.1 hypothetical protein F4815DRAFT_460962 [Daldinia loculata]